MEHRTRTSETSDSGANDEDETDPVEQLKRRYVDGEISEVEYERRLETLLETDRTLDDEYAKSELNVERE